MGEVYYNKGASYVNIMLNAACISVKSLSSLFFTKTCSVKNRFAQNQERCWHQMNDGAHIYSPNELLGSLTTTESNFVPVGNVAS